MLLVGFTLQALNSPHMFLFQVASSLFGKKHWNKFFMENIQMNPLFPESARKDEN